MARIARIDTTDGPRHVAEDATGQRRFIDGDLFGDWQISDRAAPADAPLLAPVAPPTIYCIGLNYRKHAQETGAAIPQYPVLFIKARAALHHPDQPILIPTHAPSHKVDYECELAVVIGRRAKNVRAADALDYVLGYTCANDVSARDWQMEWGGGQFCRGKSFDTFCPLGPVLVTADEIPDPNALDIRTVLNGQTVQSANTSDMIFDVPTLIEFLSADCTLEPGSVILTGTPSGVGAARTPPLWMQPGDEVRVEIDGIGVLRNPLTAS
jgi:2-keto-4-pentenoate hydratase/2-oxohepta-3-ene-1,7-dioic acid hydratase in catechol pathway